MTSSRERLGRLGRMGRAQGEMVKALEARLSTEEQKAAMLSAVRSELDVMAADLDETRLSFLPAALRRLGTAEAQLKQVLTEVGVVQRQLLEAKGRQNALVRKAGLLRSALERKAGEEEALETALAMAAKASRKHDVVS